MPRARLFAVAVAAIAVLTLACTTAVARDSSGAIIEEGSLSVFSMRPGDCFNDPDFLTLGEDTELESVTAVPCSEPHDNEVYAVVDLAGGAEDSYPGDIAMYEIAIGECLGRFNLYVGISYLDSWLAADPILPTRSSWERDGDREVVCFLYNATLVPLTGSMRGSHR